MDDTPTVTDDTKVTETGEVTRADLDRDHPGRVREARAGSISLNEGGITTATAETIDIHYGGIVGATASDIAVADGGIVLAQGETVSLDRGVLGAGMGGELRVVQSAANLVGARDAIVDQSLVMSLTGAQRDDPAAERHRRADRRPGRGKRSPYPRLARRTGVRRRLRDHLRASAGVKARSPRALPPY